MQMIQNSNKIQTRNRDRKDIQAGNINIESKFDTQEMKKWKESRVEIEIWNKDRNRKKK